MIKIFLILILLSLFSLLVVLLIKEVKEKSYLSDHLISKIIEFILDEDITSVSYTHLTLPTNSLV